MTSVANARTRQVRRGNGNARTRQARRGNGNGRTRQTGKTTKAVLALALFAFMSCHHEPTSEELTQRALEAAKNEAAEAYSHLVEGRYEQYLDCRADMSEAPDDYRRQLIDAYSQHMAQLNNAHRGIATYTVINARMDSSLQVAQVFINVTFADSTQEEILIPMVERNDRWLMK